jgi:hypothetical protein
MSTYEPDNTCELLSDTFACKRKQLLENSYRNNNNSILNNNISTSVYNIENLQPFIYPNGCKGSQSLPDKGIEHDLQKNNCLVRKICDYPGTHNQEGFWTTQLISDMHDNRVPALFNERTKKHDINPPKTKKTIIQHYSGDIYGKFT